MQKQSRFGGMAAGATLYHDTWVWNGSDWTDVTPVTSPSPRFGHGMAYDAYHKRVVLFGGQGNSGMLNDTWEWTGSDWAKRFPANQPEPRYFLGGNALACDPQRHVVVMFGGSQPYATFFEDTWEWNGTTWIERFPSASPSARSGHSLSYVASMGSVILFGGNCDYTFRNDIWSWDGTSWVEVEPEMRPPQRHRHGMAYCDLADGLVIFGGLSNLTDLGRDDTWWADCRPISFRWRFRSDEAWSDEDGLGDTDGAAFIDNVWVVGEAGTFTEDFETGAPDPTCWWFPSYEDAESA